MAFRGANVNIVLGDITGRQIDILPSERQQPGNYQVEVDAEKYKLSPGLYQLRFILDNQLVTRNLVNY